MAVSKLAVIANDPLPLFDIVMLGPGDILPDINPPKPSAICSDPKDPDDSLTLNAVINYTQTKL